MKFYEDLNLDSDVQKAIEVLGYHQPTPVQEAIIPILLNNENHQDLIVQAKTGSGKTAAFGIPLCHDLQVDEKKPQVLILTPTRELCVQICEEISQIGKYKKIRCLPVYGKQPIHIQLRQLKQRIHVIVGTPGRLLDLSEKKSVDFSELKYLIIDEADELLRRGFLEDVQKIIRKTTHERRTLLFSATMPPEIEGICNEDLQEPIRIEIPSEELPTEMIHQKLYKSEDMDDGWKWRALESFLKDVDNKSTMIFCNTREKSDQLFEKLTRNHYKCGVLHGGMAQKDRLRTISHFKNKEIPILVATDLAARGLHIDALDLVVNYQVPTEDENYVHRIGRTGRAGNSGLAITLAGGYEFKKWEEIEAFVGYQVAVSEPIEEATQTGRTHQGASPRKIEAAKHLGKQGTTPQKSAKPTPKETTKHLHSKQGIERLRVNGGKNKKLRAGDLLGAISNIPGMSPGDIGIIDVQETCSYIEIFNHKAEHVFEQLKTKPIKGKIMTVKRV